MITISYLAGIGDQVYDPDSFDWLKTSEQQNAISIIVSKLGVSAAALVGAMAEENTSYLAGESLQSLLDEYALSSIDPDDFVLAYATLGVGGALILVASAIGRRTHEEFLSDYEALLADGGLDKHEVADKALHPALVDLGPANFKLATAITLLNDYLCSVESVGDPLGLSQYANRYDILAADFVDPSSQTAAKFYGLMLQKAEKWFTDAGSEHCAYAGQWQSLPQAFRDALLVSYVNVGEKKMLELCAVSTANGTKPYEPQPLLSTGAGMNHLLNASAIGSVAGVAGYGEGITSVSDFSVAALGSAVDAFAYRYALVNLRYVALPSLDYSGRNKHGELDLYDPATGKGSLTGAYIHDRTLMLSSLVKVQLATGQAVTDLSVKEGWDYRDFASGKDILVLPDPFFEFQPLVHRVFFGGEDADTLEGQIGNDRFYGMGGNDTLKGEDGIDHLEGGSGDDKLQGGSGDDTLLGMSDNDTLDGGTGDDILSGGNGNDRYEFHSGDGNDQVNDSDGQGSLWLDGVQLEGGKEVLADAGSWRSEDSKVTYVLVSNPDQTQTLHIQYGDSLIRVNNYELGQLGITLEDSDDAPPPVNPDLNLIGDKKPVDVDPTTEEEEPEYDSLDNVVTTDEVEVRQDVLHGDVGNDSIQGLGDDDRLYGKGGNDTLDGGVGQDQLDGGTGKDLLIGGEGSDIVKGDEGDDRLYATAQVDIASIREQTEGSGLKGDWLTGGLGDDVVVGDSGKDVLFGGGGKDTVFGGAGDDVINGDDNYIATSFNWVVDSYGSTFEQYWSPVQIEQFSLDVGDNDFLYGGAGNDWVGGLMGNDYLYGDAGEDTLMGGAGHDLLFGGDDNDLLTGDYGKYAYDSGSGLVVQGNDSMDGGAGDDSIQGEAGEDLLIGAAGNDTLWGDARYLDGSDHGNDRLEGGIGDDHMFGDGGNDVLYGGEGNDQVVGDQIAPELAGQYHGQDTLYGEAGMDTMFGGGGNDQLYGGSDDDQLSGDFNVSQLAAAFHGNDVLYGDGGNDKLWGNGGNDTLYGGADNDQLQGDGAGVLDADSGDDVLFGGTGQDTLAGGGGNDTLDGGSDFDYLIGGAGDDTYIFNVGDGPHSPEGYTEFIQDAEGDNIIEFGAGITVDDVDIFLYPDGKVLLQYGGSDEVFMEGGLSGSVKTIKISDDSSYSLQGLFARNAQQAMDVYVDEAGSNLIGSAGSNQLTGTGGSSTFMGGRGDDTLIGDSGGNVYIYERGDGVDNIYDTSGHSLPDGTLLLNRVQFGAGISLQDVSLAPSSDGNLEVLIAGNPAGKLIIHNFDSNDAANTSAIEYFDFADGTSLSYASLLGSGFQVVGSTGNDNLLGSNLKDVLLGNAGDDTLSAGAGDDTLQGGAGDDLLIGGGGADLYLYAKGQGNDTLVETDDGGLNILRFAAGLGSGDIELGADPAQNLLLKIISSGEILVLANWLASATALIQRIEFADGTVWTPEWIRENLKVQSGTAGNDVLSALPGQTSVLYGMAGNDTLNGSSGDDQLVGGIGNDSLVAGLGDDSYLIQLGDGQDTLVETGGQDTVLYAEGIAANDITVSRVGTDLLLSHVNGSDKLTFKGWFSHADGRAWVEEIRFADGGVWTAGELTRKALTQVGTDGNDNLDGIDDFGDSLHGGGGGDYLRGYSGDDYLEGGAGYDVLSGGDGNDILAVGQDGGHADGGLGDDLYLYDAGDGDFGINDEGGDDTLCFGTGIRVEDAQFEREYGSLRITFADGNQIVVNNWFWYADASAMIERFAFADGTTVTAGELNQKLLVQEGTPGKDSLYGTGLDDTLIGAAGDDDLQSGAGNDQLRGDQGHDLMYAGDGDDRLEGGRGR